MKNNVENISNSMLVDIYTMHIEFKKCGNLALKLITSWNLQKMSRARPRNNM